MYGLRVLPSNVEQSGTSKDETFDDGFDAPTFDNYLEDTLEEFM
jgi:hypothetical protein